MSSPKPELGWWDFLIIRERLIVPVLSDWAGSKFFSFPRFFPFSKNKMEGKKGWGVERWEGRGGKKILKEEKKHILKKKKNQFLKLQWENVNDRLDIFLYSQYLLKPLAWFFDSLHTVISMLYRVTASLAFQVKPCSVLGKGKVESCQFSRHNI